MCEDETNPNFGKKEFSYYNNENWDDVKNKNKELMKHRIFNVVVGYENDKE